MSNIFYQYYKFKRCSYGYRKGTWLGMCDPKDHLKEGYNRA